MIEFIAGMLWVAAINSCNYTGLAQYTLWCINQGYDKSWVENSGLD